MPKSAQPWVSTLVRTIFEQPDAASVRAQHAQVVTALEAKFPAAAEHLDDAREDILAFTAFPREIWRQVWSNNPQEQGPGKVAYAVWNSFNVRCGSRAWCRLAAAMLVRPSMRSRLMARLRNDAITRGAFPVLTSDLSSW